MKRLILGFFLTCLFSSCFTSRPRIIEGDFYLQFIDFYRVFDLPDSSITKLEKDFKNINTDTVLTSSERKYIEIVQYGIKNNLLRTPYIRLRTKHRKEIMLFLAPKDYKRFDSLKCSDLKEQNKKIHIKATANNISYKALKAYKNVNLIKVEKIDGTTECGK